jgi:predicted dehydrogenase
VSDIRIGIIGYGSMAEMHARYLHKGEIANAKLGAICDIDPERLALAKERFGEDAPRFDSVEALFAAGCCDAVLIATPHYDHPPLAIQAMAAGLHVLTEKPAGVYTKQVREMNEAAAKSDRVFGIMFQQRTMPAHRKLKDLIDSGELGAIHRINWTITDWYRTESYYRSGGWRATWSGEGGGVLLNQCPHNLDLWQWFFGLPKRMRAFCYFGKDHNIEVEDDVTAFMEYESGTTATFIARTGEAPGVNRLEIACDRGLLTLDRGKLTLVRTRRIVSKHLAEEPSKFGKPEAWNCEIPAQGPNPGHAGVTEAFVKTIRGEGELIACGEEGIRSLELNNAMLLSAWTDDWADLPVDEDAYYALLQEKIKSSTYVKPEIKKQGGLAGSF